MTSRTVLIGLVGDVLVDREHPADAFTEVREILKAPDVMFANLEGSYTDSPLPFPSAPVVLAPAAHNLDVYSQVGFSVMSLANNHILDAGYKAMLNTRARLIAQGVATCGAGGSLAEAHEPAVLERNGVRMAFLAYACSFPVGYEAYEIRPGLAAMRFHSYTRDRTSSSSDDLPPCITLPDPGDLTALNEDIDRAHDAADLVILSFHWGDYTRPYELTDHETRTARHCIDRGADMVVGHHHHVLRGMEWYKGKPILYGLGHFVFDLRLQWTDRLRATMSQYDSGNVEEYSIAPRKGWPLLPMHADARMTVLAWAAASKAGISKIGFLPCRLCPDGRVHPLEWNSPESKQIVAYLKRCNEAQRLGGAIAARSPLSIAGFNTYQVIPDERK